MVYITFIRTAVAVASLFSLSNAQVTTDCNPLHVNCPNDKGLAASTYAIDFSTVKSWPSEWTIADYENVTFGPQGAEFTFAKRYDAPTMWTKFKFFFGRVEFVVKAAKGTGIVSSMVLLSDDLDEIDWEFLGGATSTVQTNYFGKGFTGTYNRSTTPAVANPQSTFYTYTLDWSPTELVWSIDGKAVRTLKAVDADGNGSQYPQTPVKVSLSLWDAGDPDAATQGWGGGVTPIPPPEPYTMYVRSVKIWNTNPAGQYQYTDKSGSYQSIRIIPDAPAPDSSSSTSSQPTETLSLGFTKSATTAATTKAPSSSATTVSGSVASSGTNAISPSTGRPASSSAVNSLGSSTGSNVAGSPSIASSDSGSSAVGGSSKTTSAIGSLVSADGQPPIVSTSSCYSGSSSASIGVDGKVTSCSCTQSSVTSYRTVTASSWPSAPVETNSTLSRLVALSKSSSAAVVATPNSPGMAPTSVFSKMASTATSYLSGSSAVASLSTSCTDTCSMPAILAFSGQTSVISSLVPSYTSMASSNIGATPVLSKAVLSSAAAASSPSDSAPISSLPNTSAYWHSMSAHYSAPADSSSSSLAAVQAPSSSARRVSSSPTSNGVTSTNVPDDGDSNNSDDSSTGTAILTSSAAISTSSPDMGASSPSSMPDNQSAAPSTPWYAASSAKSAISSSGAASSSSSIPGTAMTTSTGTASYNTIAMSPPSPSAAATSSSSPPPLPVAGGKGNGGSAYTATMIMTSQNTLTMSSKTISSVTATMTAASTSNDDSDGSDDDASTASASTMLPYVNTTSAWTAWPMASTGSAATTGSVGAGAGNGTIPFTGEGSSGSDGSALAVVVGIIVAIVMV